MVSASPIALRSAASPDTNACNWAIVSDSLSSRLFSVSRTLLRLVMTRPMTASRSASALVSDAVCPSRLATVPPSPWNTWMISYASLFTSSGDSAVNSGRNPLNSTVRSSAGLVCESGIVAPGDNRFMSPGPSDSARYRWPTRLR